MPRRLLESMPLAVACFVLGMCAVVYALTMPVDMDFCVDGNSRCPGAQRILQHPVEWFGSMALVLLGICWMGHVTNVRRRRG